MSERHSERESERGRESERERAKEQQGWMQKRSQRKEARDTVERQWRKEDKLKEGQLTLEMESLLVHSDGECAVVLVIDADHSSLVRERGGGREQAVRQRDTSCSTFHFYPHALHMFLQPFTGSLLHITTQHLTLSPLKALALSSLSHDNCFFLTHKHTHTYKCSLLEHGREEGRGG